MPTAELTIEAARLLLAADSPQLHFEAGEIAGDVQRQPTRGLHSLPMRAVAVELEIRLAHVIGNLPRRDGQSTKGDARQGAVNELAYALDRPELHLGGEIASQAFGLDIGLDRQHKGGGCEKGPILDRRDMHAVAPLLQRYRYRRLLEHGAERLADAAHHRTERGGKVVMLVVREGRRPFVRRGEGRELPSELQRDGIKRLGMDMTRDSQMGKERLIAIDRLKQDEIGDFGDAACAGIGDTATQGLAAMMEQPLYFSDESGEILGRRAIESRRNETFVEDHLLVGTNFGDTTQAQANQAGAVGAFEHQAQA